MILNNLPRHLLSEIIIVDDNSPDGTGRIVFEKCVRNKEDIASTNSLNKFSSNCQDIQSNSNTMKCSIKLVNRSEKNGLVPAILQGIKTSVGDYILIMDADFSHPPDTIPRMMNELNSNFDIIIASRYTNGGFVIGWPFKRRLISKGATNLAKYGLGIKRVRDPMSGFFVFKRNLIQDIKIDSAGYKILLEILVKANNARVKEIPYTFTNRTTGKSKLDNAVILDYIRAVYHLYLYGRKSARANNQLKKVEKSNSVLFLSKTGRFYTVGASGLLLNYLVSILLSHSSITNFGYLQATIVGIIVSNISNFFLNKFWTFEERDFSLKKTLRQYGFFAAITSGGGGIQLALLHLFVESGLQYESSLLTAVAVASVSNFLLNKKLTFKEKIWG